MSTTAVPQTTTPTVDRCALDPKWWYFLVSSGCSLVGGIIIILILRGIKLLIASRVQKDDEDRHGEVNSCILWYLRLKRRCEELVASQNVLGKCLTGLHVICSIGSFIIYIIDADDEDNLESCRHWLTDPMQIVDVAFNLYFLLHFIVRFVGNRDKLLAWVGILSLIDHFTVPPMIVAMVIGRNWLGLRFLRAFGLIGLSNMLQAWKIIRHKTSIRLAQLISLFMAIWLAGAGVMHLVEKTGDWWKKPDYERELHGYWIWFYFLLVTMSTVGYGDYSADTSMGKIFVCLFILTSLVESIGNFWNTADPEQNKMSYWIWVYFLMVTMSTVGYGDFSAQTIPGRVFVVLFIMTALFETKGNFWDKESMGTNQPYMIWLYFLIVTMSTVGYGDFSPETVLGRIFTCLFILTALGFFASCIPEIVESISAKKGMLWRGSYKRQYGEKTVVVCGHLTKSTVRTFLKDFLHKDRVVDKHLKVILLGCDQPDIEMEALLKHYMLSVLYFQGTVMNINDLDRIKIKDAIACLILSNKQCADPDQEDASAIMKVIAIKDYDPDVRIVVQLLNYQNKGHLMTIPNWSPARGDKVVCLSELKLGFMAQNCLAPGFSTLLANLFTLTSYQEKKYKRKLTWQEHYKRSAAFEMYTSKFSESFFGLTFQQAAQLCYSNLDLLLMGTDIPADESGHRNVVINPSNDFYIDYDTEGFFVAQDETEVRRVLYYCKKCHKDSSKIKLVHCKCQSTGMYKRKTSDARKRLSLLQDGEKGINSKVFSDISDDDDHESGDFNKNNNEAFVTGGARHAPLVRQPTTTSEDQLDATGLFYWCPDHSMDESVLTYQEANDRKFSDHIVLCLFAEPDSPLIGLCSFILPLRASNIHAKEIKPIIIIGNLDYLKREWTNIMNFPKVFILSTSYVPSLTKTIHIGNVQGSPLSRAYLRAANIFECSMCVILTARKNLTDELSLADKEAILCTLNIKTMPRDVMDSRTHQGSEPPGERILTITELANDYNVQYLEQDDDTDDVEIFMAQPYACGRVFTSTLLDSLMSTTYHNQNALAFIRALVTGGVTNQVEQIYAEGFGLISGNPRVNSVGRCRARVTQISLEGDERFSHFKNGCSYEAFWLHAIRQYHIIIIGLYRLLYPDQPNAFKRFVITHPNKDMSVLPSDQMFALEPFVPSKVACNTEEQTTVL